MDLNKFYTIGYIRRVIGVKGEMGIKLDVDQPSRYNGIDAVVLVKGDEKFALELAQAKVRGEELVIRSEEFSTPEEAKKLVGSTAMLPLAALPKLSDKQFYYHEIPGYRVLDSVHGEIGIAKEIIERIVQPVLLIKKGFVEILIPITDHTIQNVDREKKELHVTTPPGLIEIYLGTSSEEE